MQIKIEIDVRPEELRRFIGLPDVAGLQDDVIEFVRTKLHQAGESFDASAFVKNNLKLLSRNPLLGKLLATGKAMVAEAAMERPAGAGDAKAGSAAADNAAAAAENAAGADAKADARGAVRKRKLRAATASSTPNSTPGPAAGKSKRAGARERKRPVETRGEKEPTDSH